MSTSTTNYHSPPCTKCALYRCRCCTNQLDTCSCRKQITPRAQPASLTPQQCRSLILLRHGTSEDELNKRFAGWNDSDLSHLGQQQMLHAARTLRQANVSIDVCFTSLLKRAAKSLFIIQQETDHLWVPVHNTWRLNDRMLGHLTGFHHHRAHALFGQQQVHQWLIHPHLAPPPLPLADTRHSTLTDAHQHLSLPSTETPLDLRRRLRPFFHDELFAHLHRGHNILVVTHEDIIKVLVRLIHNFAVDQCDDRPVPIGVPLAFDFSLDTHTLYDGHYLSPTSLDDNETTYSPHNWFPTGFEQAATNTINYLSTRSHLPNVAYDITTTTSQ